MKYLPLLVALVLLSCSKERIQNRKLEGSWELWKVNDQKPSASYQQVITFEKGKKAGGSGYFQVVQGETSSQHYFTYEVENETIVFTYLDKINNTEFNRIDRLNRNKLVYIDSEGNEFIYLKI
ncbi:MAG: hypothetical protein N4A41_09685 [Crocinitomicaceae bacterium]|jgi:hypothetical protein|nr:hypothetical protein [Crocinitomicaceae bacterium]